MFDPKTLKQSKPNVAVTPQKSPAKLATMPSTVLPQDRIRERAYEMYESRGREPAKTSRTGSAPSASSSNRRDRGVRPAPPADLRKRLEGELWLA